jgi:hypothetical protein
MSESVVTAGGLLWLLPWLLCATTLGLAFGRRKRSKRWGLAVGALVFIAPIWDLPFGLIRLQRAATALGGTRIFRTANATSYLNLARTDSFSPLGISAHIAYLRSPIASAGMQNGATPYDYMESLVRTTDGGILVPHAGYWRFHLAQATSPECDNFQRWSAAAGYKLSDELVGTCVVATAENEPSSRYSYELVGDPNPEPLQGPRLLPPVMIRGSRIVDRSTGAVIAQSYVLSYRSWLPVPELDDSRLLSWKSSPTYTLDVRKVLIPDVLQ